MGCGEKIILKASGHLASYSHDPLSLLIVVPPVLLLLLPLSLLLDVDADALSHGFGVSGSDLEEYFAVACLMSLIGLAMIVDGYWEHWISDLG